jgi:alkylation response protein AidB-like acyl-CoA dehydrogenase
MDDDLTGDQQVLLDTAERFIEQTCPLGAVRQRAFDDAAFAAAYRRQAGELGWFSLLVPEALGGGSISGNGVADAALLGYARGAMLQPGEFVGTNVVAYALAVAGSDEQCSKVLPALLSGEESASWPIAAAPGRPALDGAVRARATGGGYQLSGRVTFAQDADAAWLLVTAGPAGQAAGLVAHQLAIACALTVAESVGAMHHELDMTVQYAKDRIAFGRPIGSFQAVKHVLADTSLALEMSKAVAIAAARSVGSNDGYGLEAASMAKAFVGDSGIDLAQNCFQVFGGIGFTWEHDQHLYLRRLTTDAALFGDPAWHRERVCQLSGLSSEGITT